MTKYFLLPWFDNHWSKHQKCTQLCLCTESTTFLMYYVPAFSPKHFCVLRRLANVACLFVSCPFIWLEIVIICVPFNKNVHICFHESKNHCKDVKCTIATVQGKNISIKFHWNFFLGVCVCTGEKNTVNKIAIYTPYLTVAV